MANFPEILFAESEQGRAEKLRVTADVVVGVRVQLFAVPVPPHFRGLVLALGIDRAGIPVVLLARHIVTAFEQENAFARRRQPVRERATARAGADNNDVVVCGLRHGLLPEKESRRQNSEARRGLFS